MDGFVDRLHALRFLRACDPSYRALTFPLVGLPPTGYISLLLDILFGSFLPNLWSRQTTVYSGLRSRRCYEIKWSNGTFVLTLPGQIKPSPVLNPKLPEMMIQMLIRQYRPLIWR
jgi:hypothetical protein